jgi:hypothetical protein
MKNLLKIVSIIGLTVITQIAYSAPNDVTATFTTGDTLTAEKLNNIKDVVNDNYNRITNIELTSGPVTYALGDTGPAGGFVFYVTAGGLRGLEAAPSDQDDGSGIRWDNVDNPYTNTSAIGDGVGAGAMNTTLIIANQGADSTLYAAGIAANLVITHSGVDYGDWYLPSKYELNLMWLNLADSDGDGNNAGVSDPGNLGGFASDSYWSSSQVSAGYAWAQYFGSGTQYDYSYKDGSKFNTLRVRAVRAF